MFVTSAILIQDAPHNCAEFKCHLNSEHTPLPPGDGFGAAAHVHWTTVVTVDSGDSEMAVFLGELQVRVHVPFSHVASPAAATSAEAGQ